MLVEHELLVCETLYPKQEEVIKFVCRAQMCSFASDQQRDVAVSLPVGTTSNILIQSWLREGGGGEDREEEEKEEKMRDGKEKSEEKNGICRRTILQCNRRE